MRYAWVSLFALWLCACTDLVTVEVGADRVEPIELSRTVPLSSVALPACPSATVPFSAPDARAASVSIAPNGSECVVTVRLSSVVIVDRASVAAQAQSLGDFDETALVGIDLELNELDLTDESGRSLEAAVSRASVAVDAQTLFETSSLGPQAPPPRGALPETTVAQFRRALASPADVRADLELQLVFTSAAAIPKFLDARMVVQPILLVDVVRAAL